MVRRPSLPEVDRPTCTVLAHSTIARSESMHVVRVDAEGTVYCNCHHTMRIEDWAVLGADELEGHYSPSLCAECAHNLRAVPGVSHDDLVGLRATCGEAYPDDPQERARADAAAQAFIGNCKTATEIGGEP